VEKESEVHHGVAPSAELSSQGSGMWVEVLSIGSTHASAAGCVVAFEKNWYCEEEKEDEEDALFPKRSRAKMVYAAFVPTDASVSPVCACVRVCVWERECVCVCVCVCPVCVVSVV